MGTVNYSLRIDAADKLKAEQVFRELGLSLAAGLNIYLKAVIRKQRIPFALDLNEEAPKTIPVGSKTTQIDKEKSFKAIKGILAGYTIDLKKERAERILSK